MKHVIQMWKEKLQMEMREEMSKGVSLETLGTTEKLMDNWLTADALWCKMGSYTEGMPEQEKPESRLSIEEITSWNDNMMNSDGSKGGHWTVEQTESVAGAVGVYFQHVTPAEWNVAMNMMYSDYFTVMNESSMNTPTIYAKLAKAFLLDRDGGQPALKLARYYRGVVKPAK